MNNNYKYSYRILGCSDSLSLFSFSDLNKIEDYCYVDGVYNGLSFLERKYFRYAFSTTLYNKFKYIPKGCWDNRVCRNIKKPVKQPCFIIAPSWLAFYPEVSIPDILRLRYPSCKLVLFFNDLVSTYYTYRQEPFDMDLLKSQFDKILSFDQGDCERYNLEYYPLVFSDYNIKDDFLPESDVYFIGKAKNRLPEILEAYKFLKSKGLVLDFHIAGVDKGMRIYEDEIDYNPHMDYYENLKHIARTKCLLEIMQKGGTGYTQRVFEAIGMKKKIITNNTTINKAPFYDSRLIQSYNNIFDIEDSFLEQLGDISDIAYKGADKISPIYLLEYLDSRL